MRNEKWPAEQLRHKLNPERLHRPVPRPLSPSGEMGEPMFRLIGGILGLFVIFICLASQSVAGETDIRSPAVGWQPERDVETPSYAVTEPASTNLNVDSVVLWCEQGPTRRGLQFRLYLRGDGSLTPLDAGKDLKDDPTVDLIIDGLSHSAQLFFADDFVVVADSADGAMPLLSDALLDVLQLGRRMELRFQLVKMAQEQAPAFDGIAVVDLQAGPGGAAVAAVRRCAGEVSEKLANSTSATPPRR